jgi:hypothetical protein
VEALVQRVANDEVFADFTGEPFEAAGDVHGIANDGVFEAFVAANVT